MAAGASRSGSILASSRVSNRHDGSASRPAASSRTATNEYSPETTIPINENMSKTEHQSATELADEIEALRATVEQQQQEIERLQEQKREDKATVRDALKGLDIPKPTRRQLLKSGAGSAAAMLAIWSATGGASASTIGDSSNPWDWYVNDIYDKNDNNPMSFPGDGSVSIDQLSGADIQNAASGEVPKSQGDGTLAMGTVSASNVPDFVEDGNSPVSYSGSSSYTYTLASNYDVVQVEISNFQTDGTNSGQTVDLQVNGDTGTNYTAVFGDGTVSTGVDGLPIQTLSDTNNVQSAGGFKLLMNGRWQRAFGMGHPYITSANNASGGLNVSVTSPLDQFTLVSGGSNFSYEMQVYGRDNG